MSGIRYVSRRTSELTDDELEQCSRLFSSDYGTYGQDDPKGRKGQPVRMSASYYRKHYSGENYRVALALDEGKVVAQAFYIREIIDGSIVTWVLQLVVSRDYRKMGIGSRLLHSIWGFSDDYAWGLATANPFTVKTLEVATLRHVDTSEIQRHMDMIGKMCDVVPYIESVKVTDDQSVVNTNFYIDHTGIEDDIVRGYGDSWRLGKLLPGHEWLAFTFRDQPMDEDFIDELRKLILFSEDQLKDAYGRMDMDRQPWASHAGDEIDWISSRVNLESARILDAGCGRGRHSICIAKRFPEASVVGVDFSNDNIIKAIEKSDGIQNVVFMASDLRDIDYAEEFDVILSLYDVVGSLPDNEDNNRMIGACSKACRTGGFLILSVMNMELTRSIAIAENVGDVEADPGILFRLKPASIMHRCGDVFDPEYFAIDTRTGLVFRKEQFDDESLPAEYVIRDRRYTMDEIVSIVSGCGFEVLESRYVRAGRWDTPLTSTDPKAKEIIVLARKTKK